MEMMFTQNRFGLFYTSFSVLTFAIVFHSVFQSLSLSSENNNNNNNDNDNNNETKIFTIQAVVRSILKARLNILVCDSIYHSSLNNNK